MIALSGMTFDLPTPHGRMLATIIAGIAEFERELIRSGSAPASPRPRHGASGSAGSRATAEIRPPAPKVLALVAQGRSYRLIGRELGLSKNTVADIVKWKRTTPAAPSATRCSRSVPGTVLSCPFYGGTPSTGADHSRARARLLRRPPLASRP